MTWINYRHTDDWNRVEHYLYIYIYPHKYNLFSSIEIQRKLEKVQSSQQMINR